MSNYLADGRFHRFGVRRSSFVIRRSSFVVRRSSFVVRRSSFVVPSFLRSFVPSFLPLFRRSFLCSFLPSFLHSFVCWFVGLLVCRWSPAFTFCLALVSVLCCGLDLFERCFARCFALCFGRVAGSVEVDRQQCAFVRYCTVVDS